MEMRKNDKKSEMGAEPVWLLGPHVCGGLMMSFPESMKEGLHF